MPSGYSVKCKTCNSTIRTEIESWHVKDGMDFIAISLRLKSMGIEISDRALSSHFNNHYNVQTEAREQYHKSQEQIVKDADVRLTDLQILDEMIQDGHIIHKGLSEQLKKDPKGVSLPIVQLYNGSSAEVCRAIKTKQDLLGEDGASKQADAIELLSEAEIDARLIELTKCTISPEARSPSVVEGKNRSTDEN